jgi:hypothetical protein
LLDRLAAAVGTERLLDIASEHALHLFAEIIFVKVIDRMKSAAPSAMIGHGP